MRHIGTYHEWTEVENLMLTRARSSDRPATYGELAKRLGLTEMAVRIHCRKIGLARLKLEAVGPYTPKRSRGPSSIASPGDERELARRGYEALPAGHRETWGLLTQGTLLEGVPWPA